MPERKSPFHTWVWFVAFICLLAVLQQLPIGQRLNMGMAPLLSVLQAPGQWWQRLDLWFEDSEKLQTQYQQVREKLEQQATLRQELNSLREENIQLRKLLKISDLNDFTWQAAKVQGRSPDKMSQRLIILVHETKVDDVVVSSDGLVGLIDQSKRHIATVRTILDASIAVPVTQSGSTIAALARGQGDELLIDFIPLKQAPSVGSIMHTSGAGGLFPAGIPVARITKVEPIPGRVFARVSADPVAHWQRESWLAVASRSGSHTASITTTQP